MKLNKKTIISICSYLTINLVMYIFLINMNVLGERVEMNIIFFMIVIHLISTYGFLYINKIIIMSIPNIFITLLYIFNLGQILIKGINKNYILEFDVVQLNSSNIIFKSVIFTIIIITLITIGVLLGKNVDKKEIDLIKKFEINRMRNVGIVILMISFPIEIYLSIQKIIVFINNGYLDVLDVEKNGIISQIARFHIIGIALLIMVYSQKKKISEYIFVMYTIYSIITMMSGSRIYQMISILVLGYILVKCKKIKLKFKNIFLISISIGVLGLILVTLADFRGENIKEFSVFKEIFIDKIKNNFLFDIVSEFGGTLQTLCVTIAKVPNSIEYSNGEQFIKGFSVVIPNIGGSLSEWNESIGFVNKLNYETLGGSYIAELYYSFKLAWIGVALFTGYVLQKISLKVDRYIIHKQYVKVAYLIMPIFSIFLWVRGEYIGILRNSIWGIIYIYIVCKIVLILSKISNGSRSL